MPTHPVHTAAELDAAERVMDTVADLLSELADRFLRDGDRENAQACAVRMVNLDVCVELMSGYCEGAADTTAFRRCLLGQLPWPLDGRTESRAFPRARRPSRNGRDR